MLAELKQIIDSDVSWTVQPLTSEDRFMDVRNYLDYFLDGGEKTKYGLIDRLLNLGEAGNTWRSMDVEVGNDKCHLAVRCRSLDHREDEIYVTLYSTDYKRSAQVTIPSVDKFESDNSGIDYARLLRNISLMEEDVLPLVKKRVEEDRKKNRPAIRGDL